MLGGIRWATAAPRTEDATACPDFFSPKDVLTESPVPGTPPARNHT